MSVTILVIFSSIFGAISRDVLEFSLDSATPHRVSRVFVSSVVSFFVVGFGVRAGIPEMDKKMLIFMSFVIAFAGVSFAKFLIDKTNEIFNATVDKILSILEGKK